VAYGDQTDGLGEAVVVSATAGRVVTAGSSSTFNAAGTSYVSMVYDENAAKCLICYRDDGGDDFGHTKVATVTGDSVAFGTEDTFNGVSTNNITATYDSAAQKTLISFYDVGGSTHQEAIVATITGTDATFGSAISIWDSALTTPDGAYDSMNNKHLISGGVASAGVLRVVSVSGTGATAETQGCYCGKIIGNTVGVAFDSIQNKFIVSFADDNEAGTAFFVDVSLSTGGMKIGGAIEFGGSIAPYYPTVATNNLASNNKALLVFPDSVAAKSYGVVVELDSRDAAIGVAQTTASAGTSNGVKPWGSASTIHTGLTMGAQYFISAAGEPTLLKTGYPLGLSTSATNINLDRSDEPRITQGWFESGATTDNTIYHGLGKMPRKITIYPAGSRWTAGASDNSAPLCVGTPGNLQTVYSYLETVGSEVLTINAGYFHNTNSESFDFYTGNDANQKIYWTAEA